MQEGYAVTPVRALLIMNLKPEPEMTSTPGLDDVECASDLCLGAWRQPTELPCCGYIVSGHHMLAA